jgi:hypothetical protein
MPDRRAWPAGGTEQLQGTVVAIGEAPQPYGEDANAKSLGNLRGSHSCRGLNPFRAGSRASLGLGLPAPRARVLPTVCVGLPAILCIRLCVPARVHPRLRLPSGLHLSALRIHLCVPTPLCIWLPAIWGLRLRRIWPAALVRLAPPLVVTGRAGNGGPQPLSRRNPGAGCSR